MTQFLKLVASVNFIIYFSINPPPPRVFLLIPDWGINKAIVAFKQSFLNFPNFLILVGEAH